MLKKIALGNTEIEVSRLGLGTVKFGRNQQVKYPAAFELPKDADLLNLLAEAKDLGINLLDTAPAYGASEERLGHLLQQDRNHWVICTKFGEEFLQGASHFDFSKKAAQTSIERSLKRLKTDYLDIVLVHSDGQDQKIIEEGVLDYLAEFKKAGKARAIGMSTKTIEGGKWTVDHADVVMVTYNLLEQNDRPVLQYAAQKNKAVLIKKAFASGHLQKLGDQPIESTMNFIFKEPGVTSIILGTINRDHLRMNVACAEGLSL